MTELRAVRRLAAILVADVVGYSALVRSDEEGTLARFKRLSEDILVPLVAERRGRIVKFTGDGMLAEFASAVDAAECAIAIQSNLGGTPDALPLRIGVHVGDVVVEDGDLFGDGVNLAARLQALAYPGGVSLSDDAYRQVRATLAGVLSDGGEHRVKNISEPLRVWQWRSARGEASGTAAAGAPEPQQSIRFCKSSDRARIAFATVGEGPPLLKTSNWLTHIDLDWASPLWRALLLQLARTHTLIRYDHRGTGLSDWKVAEISFDKWIDDLESVVAAADLARFSILGISQGCATACAFAARHPEMVDRMVLLGGFAKGWRASKTSPLSAQWEPMITLMRQGWGQENPAFRHVFTSLFAPTATEEQKRWLDEFQRASASSENAARVMEALGELDVVDQLPKIACPTLVLHCREDAIVPFDAGRMMAARIPNARFVTLESKNHILFPGDPAWEVALGEITRFLAG